MGTGPIFSVSIVGVRLSPVLVPAENGSLKVAFSFARDFFRSCFCFCVVEKNDPLAVWFFALSYLLLELFHHGMICPPNKLQILQLQCLTMALSDETKGGGSMDPLWKAMSKLRRGKLDECIEICNDSLARHPNDQVIHTSRTVIYDM